MILKRQNMSENKWNHFKIVPQGHNNCQLSIVNCQFGEAAKFQFAAFLSIPSPYQKASHGVSMGGSLLYGMIQDSSSLSSASSEPEAWLNRLRSCSTVRFFLSSPLTSTTILPSYIITSRLP